jgi:hypothetical protein
MDLTGNQIHNNTFNNMDINMTIEKFTGEFMKEENGCTITINSTIQSITDTSVLGLYCYLMTKPNTWTINVAEIKNHFKISKDKAYRLLNALIDLKLISVKVISQPNMFSKNYYTLHLRPRLENSPCPENQESIAILPCPGFTDPENQDAYKTKNIQNKEINNNISDNPENQDTKDKVTEVIEAYHEELPDCPKIRKPDRQLKAQINAMIKNWEYYQKDGKKFTIDLFRDYLRFIKTRHSWIITPRVNENGQTKRNNLRTLTREINLSRFSLGEFYG